MHAYARTTAPANTQEVYERIRSWIGRPGAQKCQVSFQYCVYRDNGNRCAIGGVLPAPLLDLVGRFEGGVIDLIDNFPAVREFFKNCNEDFLIAAQDAHDMVDDGDGPVEHAEWQRQALRRLDESAESARLLVVS